MKKQKKFIIQIFLILMIIVLLFSSMSAYDLYPADYDPDGNSSASLIAIIFDKLSDHNKKKAEDLSQQHDINPEQFFGLYTGSKSQWQTISSEILDLTKTYMFPTIENSENVNLGFDFENQVMSSNDPNDKGKILSYYLLYHILNRVPVNFDKQAIIDQQLIGYDSMALRFNEEETEEDIDYDASDPSDNYKSSYDDDNCDDGSFCEKAEENREDDFYEDSDACIPDEGCDDYTSEEERYDEISEKLTHLYNSNLRAWHKGRSVLWNHFNPEWLLFNIDISEANAEERQYFVQVADVFNKIINKEFPENDKEMAKLHENMMDGANLKGLAKLRLNGNKFQLVMNRKEFSDMKIYPENKGWNIESRDPFHIEGMQKFAKELKNVIVFGSGFAYGSAVVPWLDNNLLGKSLLLKLRKVPYLKSFLFHPVKKPFNVADPKKSVSVLKKMGKGLLRVPARGVSDIATFASRLPTIAGALFYGYTAFDYYSTMNEISNGMVVNDNGLPVFFNTLNEQNAMVGDITFEAMRALSFQVLMRGQVMNPVSLGILTTYMTAEFIQGLSKISGSKVEFKDAIAGHYSTYQRLWDKKVHPMLHPEKGEINRQKKLNEANNNYYLTYYEFEKDPLVCNGFVDTDILMGHQNEFAIRMNNINTGLGTIKIISSLVDEFENRNLTENEQMKIKQGLKELYWILYESDNELMPTTIPTKLEIEDFKWNDLEYLGDLNLAKQNVILYLKSYLPELRSGLYNKLEASYGMYWKYMKMSSLCWMNYIFNGLRHTGNPNSVVNYFFFNPRDVSSRGLAALKQVTVSSIKKFWNKVLSFVGIDWRFEIKSYRDAYYKKIELMMHESKNELISAFWQTFFLDSQYFEFKERYQSANIRRSVNDDELYYDTVLNEDGSLKNPLFVWHVREATSESNWEFIPLVKYYHLLKDKILNYKEVDIAQIEALKTRIGQENKKDQIDQNRNEDEELKMESVRILECLVSSDNPDKCNRRDN
ncbi:MAG: hypothetical protein ABIA04_15685 [Pseudomonadota bacterium]